MAIFGTRYATVIVWDEEDGITVPHPTHDLTGWHTEILERRDMAASIWGGRRWCKACGAEEKHPIGVLRPEINAVIEWPCLATAAGRSAAKRFVEWSKKYASAK